MDELVRTVPVSPLPAIDQVVAGQPGRIRRLARNGLENALPRLAAVANGQILGATPMEEVAAARVLNALQKGNMLSASIVRGKLERMLMEVQRWARQQELTEAQVAGLIEAMHRGWSRKSQTRHQPG